MGGSHFPANLLKIWEPDVDLITWNSYGLPKLSASKWKNRLVIASSYSGNTAETIDAFLEAKRRKLSVAIIASGGKLIKLAQEYRVPYIAVPNSDVQPRMATGLIVRAILKFMKEEKVLKKIESLGRRFLPSRLESAGRKLAHRIRGKIPIIYASNKNSAIARVWKIKFNETGKIPAFFNVLPEQNHNEMTGFDMVPRTSHLSSRFHFIFLSDKNDDSRITKRMYILKDLYRRRKLPVEVIPLKGLSIFERTFSSLILADWAAYYTAKYYGVDPEAVPMVEEFKKLIRG
jgi:glucose/mannose-6-phosphate isomerase